MEVCDMENREKLKSNKECKKDEIKKGCEKSKSDSPKSEEESEKSLEKISGSSEEFEEIELECISKREYIEESEEEKERREENEEFIKDEEIQIKCEMKLFETLKYKDFLNKFVKVKTYDHKYHFGLLKYLDPMSGDMIIVNVREEKPHVIEKTLILKDSCVSVALLDKHNSEDGKVLPFLTVQRRKICLINWIRENKLSVNENKDGSLLVSDVVTVHAPYEPEACICDNPLMLQQTKELIQNLPFERLSIEAELESAANEIVTHKS